MTLSALVRHFADNIWAPSEIALQSQQRPGECLHRAFLDARIVTGQTDTCVTLPVTLLRLTSNENRAGRGGKECRSAASGPSTWDFASSLRAILPSYLSDGYPDISLVAGSIGCSVRTLQRRLKDCRERFSDVVQQARFEVAAQLLQEPDTRVIEAAYAAGYSDPSHFARAFRRQAGVSPKVYQTHKARDHG